MCQYLLQANQPQLLRLCLHNQKQKLKELCEANVNQLPTSTYLAHCQQNVSNISINRTRSKFHDLFNMSLCIYLQFNHYLDMQSTSQLKFDICFGGMVLS